MSRSSRIAADPGDHQQSPCYTGIGGTALAQAAPLQSAGGLGSLDLGSIGLDSWDLGSSQPSADAPRLVGIDNFRDVAGTGAGYSGSLGRHVNTNVFYRVDAVTPRATTWPPSKSLD